MQGVPVSGYNPMTSKDPLGTVTALMTIGAEKLGRETAEECLERLQALRAVLTTIHGLADTVDHAVGQEGLARALAGDLTSTTTSPSGADDAVAEAQSVVGADTALGTKVGLLYGDDAATSMSWTPLGIEPYAGYWHATACARAALMEWPASTLVTNRWAPSGR